MNVKKQELKEANEAVEAYSYIDKSNRRIVVYAPIRILEQVKEAGLKKHPDSYKELN